MALPNRAQSIGTSNRIFLPQETELSQTLDDVDFTVLAATSVLGDLMENCPPAEACRDAFERMSKATVQMCLSTTGFGSRVNTQRERSNTQPRHPFAKSTAEDISSYPDYSSESIRSAAQQASFKSRRPPPKFDMNLRDLFPDENTLGSFSNPFSEQLQQNQVQVQTQTQTQAQQQQQPTFNSQLNEGLGRGGDPSDASTVNTLQAHQTQNTNPPFYYDSSTHGSDFVSIPGMDFLSNDVDDLNVDTSGIDLGLGMGMDFQHDWSDGTQFDLFDGFFFGGGPGGTS